jgi:hypothetical protein
LAVAEQLGGSTRPWSSDRASDRIYLSLSKSLDAAA